MVRALFWRIWIMSTERVICIKNGGFSAFLVVNTVYETLPDDSAVKRNMIRVVDESGRACLYPAELFSSYNSWEKAVGETIEEHFRSAQASFDRGDHLGGSETLADAVREGLRYIAAGRNWPHCTDDDLYRTAAALATGSEFPSEEENLYILLDGASVEGMDLCGALAASLGRPDAVRFGLYGDRLENVRDDATSFARSAIDLALRLAWEGAATP